MISRRLRQRAAPLMTALALLLPAIANAAPPQERQVQSGGNTPKDTGTTSTTTEGSPDEIVLAVGETKAISAKDVRNYSEGAPGIIDVKLTSDNSQFVLAARKPGSTTMLLIKSDGTNITLTIHVFTRPPAVVEKELAQLLDGLTGVKVRRVGARIVMDGVVANDVELKRVQHVASLYPNQVESLVTLPGGAAGSIVDSKYIVRIDFYFVQYDKNSTYGVGFGWPTSVGGDAVVKSAVTFDFVGGSRAATATITNQPIPRLDIASRKGWAKVLKQATVVTNNGIEANFSNGGEQNFTVNTGLTVGVQRIQFGTDITVLPKYNATKREIEMKLVADVSDLTAATGGATTLPGRTTSKLTTNITLKLGQSIVLSGIRTKSQTHTIDGLPGLKDIPVLGLLFGTHSNDEQQTEGAIFVVPNVVEAVNTQTSEMVDSAIAKFEDYSGALEGLDVYDKRPGAQPKLVK